MRKEELLNIAKPVVFCLNKVQSVLSGKTREFARIIKPQPVIRNNETGPFIKMDDGGFQMQIDGYKNIFDYPVYPQYEINDILYVKEAWSPVWVIPRRYLYKASCTEAEGLPLNWHSPVCMPKEAARIFLRITNVRVVQTQDLYSFVYEFERVIPE